jgi:hypothetical protein
MSEITERVRRDGIAQLNSRTVRVVVNGSAVPTANGVDRHVQLAERKDILAGWTGWVQVQCLPIPLQRLKGMAGTTGLEPAASAVTGQRSNQLNYVPTC